MSDSPSDTQFNVELRQLSLPTSFPFLFYFVDYSWTLLLPCLIASYICGVNIAAEDIGWAQIKFSLK